MCGSETLTTVVSSTSMKVANMTATATIHGLTWGCGSAEDGIRYYFHDAAKPPSDAWSCQCPSLWGGQSCPQPAFLPAGPAGKRVRSLKGLPHKRRPHMLRGLCGQGPSLGGIPAARLNAVHLSQVEYGSRRNAGAPFSQNEGFLPLTPVRQPQTSVNPGRLRRDLLLGRGGRDQSPSRQIGNMECRDAPTDVDGV